MSRLVLISDVSRKYAQLTARRVREQNVFCEVAEPGRLIEQAREKRPLGIILTGDAADAGLITKDIKEGLSELDIPVWAIGAGADALRGTRGKVTYSALTPGLTDGSAKAEAADFLFSKCGCAPDWTADSFVKETVGRLREELAGKKVICALSGGVDSTVAAVLVHKAIGDRLICIFVDHGLMRKNEGDRVMETLSDNFDMSVTRVDAEARFLTKLRGVTDPEQKRKIIGAEFIEVFAEEAERHEGAEYLLQGTIYPDVLESGLDGAKNIKSHHNVGGLPEKMGFRLVEPLRPLFKDEVRRVGTTLGIPGFIVDRQPFPGPGLGVRCLGELTKPRLDVLRECDAIVCEEIENSGLSKRIWQYFAVLPNIKSVGADGGERTYRETAVIRAVHSVDAMTADYAKIPYEVIDKITARIFSEVPQINRVALDVTGKPPATIEWE